MRTLRTVRPVARAVTRPLSALRRLVDDDPLRGSGGVAPRSHPVDPFELTGSSFHRPRRDR